MLLFFFLLLRIFARESLQSQFFSHVHFWYYCKTLYPSGEWKFHSGEVEDDLEQLILFI